MHWSRIKKGCYVHYIIMAHRSNYTYNYVHEHACVRICSCARTSTRSFDCLSDNRKSRQSKEQKTLNPVLATPPPPALSVKSIEFDLEQPRFFTLEHPVLILFVLNLLQILLFLLSCCHHFFFAPLLCIQGLDSLRRLLNRRQAQKRVPSTIIDENSHSASPSWGHSPWPMRVGDG